MTRPYGWEAVYGEDALLVPELVEVGVLVDGRDTVKGLTACNLPAVARETSRSAMRGSRQAPPFILPSPSNTGEWK